MSVEATKDVGAGARSGRPGHMPWVTPYLIVKDVPAALDFYEAAFGFRKRFANAGPDGVISHGEAAWQDGLVMMGREGAYGGTNRSPSTSGVASPVSIYVYCDDVDALHERARAAGATITHPPMDAVYGDRICGIVDPDGHAWCFATHPAEADGPDQP
jgi:PhnB protein